MKRKRRGTRPYLIRTRFEYSNAGPPYLDGGELSEITEKRHSWILRNDGN